MTDKETEELNRWCHGFLDKCLHEKDVGRFVMSHQMKKEVLGYRTGDVYLFSCRECFADSVEGLWRFPDYTTSLDLAAKVEAKAIETAGWQPYCDALWDWAVRELQTNPMQNLPQLITTADALARCQASRAAVEDCISMCRCGHENADHKQMFDEGRPTSHFPCRGYGCVCGKFEEIDWEESDANHEAFMDYQRSVKQ